MPINATFCPGLWVEDGVLHMHSAVMCEHFGIEATDENLEAMELGAIDALKEQGFLAVDATLTRVMVNHN